MINKYTAKFVSTEKEVLQGLIVKVARFEEVFPIGILYYKDRPARINPRGLFYSLEDDIFYCVSFSSAAEQIPNLELFIEGDEAILIKRAKEDLRVKM